MAYTPFVKNKPDIADTGGTVIDNTRINLMALRDAVVTGRLVGWAMSTSGGSADRPAVMSWAKGTEIIRATVTWGTSGGSKYNPTVIAYDYSSDTGTTYVAIGTLTLTYDVNGNMTSSAWS